ncbi:MAG: hypothetical protein R3E13_12130 [Alphaproteobacteria bacterium]
MKTLKGKSREMDNILHRLYKDDRVITSVEFSELQAKLVKDFAETLPNVKIGTVFNLRHIFTEKMGHALAYTVFSDMRYAPYYCGSVHLQNLTDRSKECLARSYERAQQRGLWAEKELEKPIGERRVDDDELNVLIEIARQLPSSEAFILRTSTALASINAFTPADTGLSSMKYLSLATGASDLFLNFLHSVHTLDDYTRFANDDDPPSTKERDPGFDWAFQGI